MTLRVEVRPELLEWARARSGIGDDIWDNRFPKYRAWVSGERAPTFKQLEEFASKTNTPFGYLLLSEPPDEPLPLADFRVVAGTDQARPSANLLDTIYICQQRQEWYRDDARSHGESPLAFIGSMSTATGIQEAAEALAEQLEWDAEARRSARDWQGAWAWLRDLMESAGVMVMITGHVGSNTHRTLDPDEFRGFTLVDNVAPLVFVNGSDSKSAQVFTLVHELAHLWLGQPGLDDLEVPVSSASDAHVEKWCNAVAAEVLVPLAELRQAFDSGNDLFAELGGLARRFRVSKLVVLGRLREAGFLSWERYWELRKELREAFLTAEPVRSTGGDFYPGALVATSRRFAEALVVATLEGRTLYRDAFQMLGIKSQKAFEGLVERLGVA